MPRRASKHSRTVLSQCHLVETRYNVGLLHVACLDHTDDNAAAAWPVGCWGRGVESADHAEEGCELAEVDAAGAVLVHLPEARRGDLFEPVVGSAGGAAQQGADLADIEVAYG